MPQPVVPADFPGGFSCQALFNVPSHTTSFRESYATYSLSQALGSSSPFLQSPAPSPLASHSNQGSKGQGSSQGSKGFNSNAGFKTRGEVKPGVAVFQNGPADPIAPGQGRGKRKSKDNGGCGCIIC